MVHGSAGLSAGQREALDGALEMSVGFGERSPHGLPLAGQLAFLS